MSKRVSVKRVFALVVAGAGAAVMLSACSVSTNTGNGVTTGPGGVLLFQPVQAPKIQFTAPKTDILEQAAPKAVPQEQAVSAPVQSSVQAKEVRAEKTVAPAQDAMKTYGGCAGKSYSGYAP
ncbi:MAG: hypothetical protein RMN25_11335 [Anaerolineae bacterium]|nr:hypothetical protein [Thermoflexales bacterium]MDW8408362.1 hypothetical protein [Anaerolineae bacterium]